MKNPFVFSNRTAVDQFCMTPDLAAYLLEHYNHNNVRPLDTNEATKRIAGAIREGLWRKNSGARLLFEANTGRLFDGQTRLAGIVAAGIPVHLDVLCGIAKEDAVLTDTQRPRSIAASWALHLNLGQGYISRLNRLVAITRIVANFDCDGWGTKRWPRMQLLEMYQRDMNGINAMGEQCANPYANRSGFRGACAVYYRTNPVKAVEFFRLVSLAKPETLPDNSPVNVLRDYLMHHSLSKHPQKRLELDATATLAMCYAYEFGKLVAGISHKYK